MACRKQPQARMFYRGASAQSKLYLKLHCSQNRVRYFICLLLLTMCSMSSEAAGPPISDDFNVSTLNTALWTFVNPVGNGSYSFSGSDLLLVVPAGSNHDPAFGGTNNAVRIVQPTSNVDFTVTVKFDSIPTAQYQFE